MEWLTTSSGGPSEVEPIWQVTVDAKVRPYLDASSVDEYIAIKRRLSEEASRQLPPAVLLEATQEDSQFEARASPAGDADPHTVFVVYGRNEAARVAMFELLRAFGLHPLEWSELRAATGKPSPYVGEILEAGFAISQACVVLMTPDEEVRLRDEFVEDDIERIVSHQPRPNVLLEAGMALDKYRARTVIIELGKLRPVSDLGGIHTLRIDDSEPKRRELAERLRDAHCDVRLEGQAWKTAGDFALAIGAGPPAVHMPSVDTNAERTPVASEVARQLEAELEDANDLIGDALTTGRFWKSDRRLPTSIWDQHESSFARLGRDIDKPVRDAFRKLKQFNIEAAQREATEEGAVGAIALGPTLAFGAVDSERLANLQGVLIHGMDVLRALQR